MITIKEFCLRTGKHHQTVRNWIKQGKLEFKQEKHKGKIYVDYDKYIGKIIEENETLETPEESYQFIKHQLKKTIDLQLKSKDPDHNSIVRNLMNLHKIESYLVEKGAYDNR